MRRWKKATANGVFAAATVAAGIIFPASALVIAPLLTVNAGFSASTYARGRRRRSGAQAGNQ